MTQLERDAGCAPWGAAVQRYRGIPAPAFCSGAASAPSALFLPLAWDSWPLISDADFFSKCFWKN